MGVDLDPAMGDGRFSMGRETIREDVESVIGVLQDAPREIPA